MTDRGAFIAIEGIDGAGTTTQVQQLASWLRERGREVHATREPSDGPIGTLVRQVLTGRLVSEDAAPFDPAALALLFAADRLDHVAATIAPRCDAGTVVLSDRYVASSLAYQSLDLPREWVAAINGRARRPDAVVYVRVEVDVALARIQRRQGEQRERFERRDLLERVVAEYDALAAAAGDWVVIDGAQPAEAVARALRGALATRVPSWPGDATLAASQTRRVRGSVRGRVQGVCYRANACERARDRGVAGWVRNLPDGRVEFEAEGPHEAIEDLLAFARVGPPLARVERVDIEPSDSNAPLPSPFAIR